MTVRSRQELSFRACALVDALGLGHVGRASAGADFHHLIATLSGRCRSGGPPAKTLASPAPGEVVPRRCWAQPGAWRERCDGLEGGVPSECRGGDPRVSESTLTAGFE